MQKYCKIPLINRNASVVPGVAVMKKHKQLKVLICIILLLSFLASSAVAFAASNPLLRKGMKSEAVKTPEKPENWAFNTGAHGIFR